MAGPCTSWRHPQDFPLPPTFCRPGSLRSETLRERFRHRLVLGAEEMRGEILSEQGIHLGARDRFLRVLGMFVAGPRQSDQSGGKFHLRIIAAERNGLLDHGVTIHT